MRTMLAAAVNAAEHLDLIEVAARLGGAHAIKPVAATFAAEAAAVEHGIETVERPKQALGAAYLGGKFLDLRFGRRRANRRRRDAKKAGSALIGRDQTILPVQADAHPRALLP